MDDTAADLLRSLKVTSGSRFNAGKRLEHHDRRLTMVTAGASAYVIALTVLLYFVSLPRHVSDNLNLATVVLSIVVLVSSLLQYSSSNTVRSELHHRSALEINELRREPRIKLPTITDDQFLDLSTRYSLVLQKFAVNHDDVDYARYQLERRSEFPWLTSFDIFTMSVEQWWARNAPHVVLGIMTLLFLWMFFGYALPMAVPRS